MRKIQLSIAALATNESQSNNFVVILKEEGGTRRLPVVIGGFEAQAIAIAIEKIKPNRPLTHDLLVGVVDSLGAELDSVRAVGRMARDGGRCVEPEVVIFGGSQGGHAALWTELLAPYYADELVLRGTVATVPPSEPVARLSVPKKR